VPVTIQDVEHVAALARLRFSDSEKQTLILQLNAILDSMEHLNRLDTSTVEPLAQVVDRANIFRDDTPVPGVSREEALRNAPATTDVFFRVPNVLGNR
jgi:aspartyl-tRNA(Asn)/glutamyl-tRNA(Gln) amidotransferase subunit C